MLKLQNISKSFGGVQAVKNCSFEIEKNSITALVGPNGAGKTTVFNLVSGFSNPDKGDIFFENKKLNHLPIWKRSRLGISRTFQLSRMFRNLSIEDNLLIALREDDDKFLKMFLRDVEGDKQEKNRIYEIMDFVGLKKDPKTIVTDLSYGQQKLFDLSRALLNSHEFLMLDEPVAGVNPILRDTFKKLLKELKAKGETILLIEHDMDFVRHVADTVIVMDQGSVLAEGDPEYIFSDKKVLEAYLGTTV
ncbi:ABC transporter ATP-binding protein [Candidatus Uhrbacteria bacterium]|nr:ABC transporter ATP-binding protein [Candidatus Uhrbacteria bacterium]